MKKPILVLCLTLCLGSMSRSVLAEMNGTAPTPAPPAANPPTRGIQVFDDRVFNLGVDQPPKPSTRKSEMTGTQRYLADEPDYNTQQRQEWIDSCTVAGQVSKDCFDKEKKKSADDLRNKYNKVERDQGVPVESRSPSVEKTPSSAPLYRDVEIEPAKSK